ncbi:hypothetical protein B9P84_27010 [Citrobacter braakii]|uniref:hypothetical protein n=1 Tax=Gammaproteobacteria TaxID=1236 RepID=UPI000B9A3F67|nr:MULTISPECIES: hypothetical protein [Gammaproteobacteria]AWA04492.1 hypothetical protein C1A23_01830 [Aeromonas hydrophila subsp. hydrophila]MCJ7978362.1 hypothetical protein [Aeromonas veronii]MDV1777768.1 hypothetical protein [Citrobacter freundii]MEB0394356.1 hypothetical protein [Citrobacter freundii]OXU08813.1 hypothetical protein B9P84_27010 [Citrobacter braakii]
MEYWREFQALVAIGFNNQFSVIELESADERALGMVQDDISEAGWANCAGIDTDVPGLYMVKASINLNSDDEPEYANTVQSVVRYTLSGEAAHMIAPVFPDDEMNNRRIAACVACCAGEEFTIERLESGLLNLRGLVDQAFLASEAHVHTTGKLLAVTEQRNDLMKRLCSLLEATLGYQEWIKAIPDDVAAALPTVPGIDGDWVAEAISAAQASVSLGESGAKDFGNRHMRSGDDS